MFKLNISPELREAIDRENRESLRLYGLQNAWLATALLQLARRAQASAPNIRFDEYTYESRLIWGIIPELARRLGVIRMTTNEIDWEVRELSDYQLRIRTGYTLKNIGYSRKAGWDVLSRDVANGNVVVYALDRLCPGRLEDRDDPLVVDLSSMAAVRQCPYAGVWTPAMVSFAQTEEGEGGENCDEVESGVAPGR